MSISRRIDKLCCIWTMEYYSGMKRNAPSCREHTWRNLKSVLLSEKSHSENTAYLESQLHDIWQRQNYRGSLKISGGQGLCGREGGRDGGAEHRGPFLCEGEPILYNVIMVDTGCYTFAQTHRMSNMKREP